MLQGTDSPSVIRKRDFEHYQSKTPVLSVNCYVLLSGILVDAKKALRICSGALSYQAANALLNFNKLRIAGADHSLCVDKAIHVNRGPAAVHEHEVRVPDQPEMGRTVSLDEELFRVPSKTEHFGVTRPELFLVHCCRLIRASHVSLARASARAGVRTCARFISVYLLSATLNVRLARHLCAGLRFCLGFGRLLLLRGTHLLPFRRRSSLRFLRLLLRLLWLRLA